MTAGILLGFLLGIRHSLDADHIVAVTSIIARGQGLLRSSIVGLSWGAGHTITILAVGFGVLVLKLNIPDVLALSLEFVVGVVLVVLGVPLLRRLAGGAHIHTHAHGERRHWHAHSHDTAAGHEHRHVRGPLAVGMVHGLAGSGALVLLVLSSMASVPQGLLFLLLFGAGSILGMLVISGLLGLPFRYAAGRGWDRWLHGAVGLGSIAFGVFIMWRVGFADGLLSLLT